jgi:hypothetical protein
MLILFLGSCSSFGGLQRVDLLLFFDRFFLEVGRKIAGSTGPLGRWVRGYCAENAFFKCDRT